MLDVDFETLFLGLQAENRRFCKETLEFLVDEQTCWRRSVRAASDFCVNPPDQRQADCSATVRCARARRPRMSARLFFGTCSVDRARRQALSWSIVACLLSRAYDWCTGHGLVITGAL
jgi:hypothetical protein